MCAMKKYRRMICGCIGSDSPYIPVPNYKQQLDGIGDSEIATIKSFIVLNKDILLRLCDSEDEYDFSDFVRDMKKV